MSNTELEYELSPEEKEAAALKKEKQRKRRKTARIFDRIAGFIIATVIVIGCALLGLLYVIEKGPSPSLRDAFVNTMDETRRFKFVPAIFLETEELDSIRKAAKMDEDVSTDTSLINISSEDGNSAAEDNLQEMGLVDEDGDGVRLPIPLDFHLERADERLRLEKSILLRGFGIIPLKRAVERRFLISRRVNYRRRTEKPAVPLSDFLQCFQLRHFAPPFFSRARTLFSSLISNVPHPIPVELLLSGRPSQMPTCIPARAMRFTTSLAVNWSAS